MTTGLPAGTKLGRYEVVKHLARGGMADLSIARTTGIEGFERHVVVKHLRPEQSNDDVFVQMFAVEARLAAALHHNNIVQVHDIGHDDGRHFFTMEYVHGEDVRRLLAILHKRQEQPPLAHVLTIVTSVAAALHYAHEQKGPDRKPLDIVHRDITPGNILVGYDGTVKVVDFGIAKAAMRRAETTVGMLKGKVPYMSPEQCTGKGIDRRSDVFSLGIVLHELVTVRRLFKGGNEFVTMRQITQGDFPKPSLKRLDLPPALEAIILKALARLPADRYQTAEELRLALDQFADDAGIRTSTTALADYMKQLFGERPEPWFTDDPLPKAPTDYDRADSTPTPGASSSFDTPSGSVLERARVEAMRDQLAIESGTRDLTPPSVRVLEDLDEPPRRDRRWMFAGAAAIAVVIFGIAIAMRGGDDPPVTREPAVAAPEPTPVKRAPPPKPEPEPEVPKPEPPKPVPLAVEPPVAPPAPPVNKVAPKLPPKKPPRPPPKWDPNALLP